MPDARILPGFPTQVLKNGHERVIELFRRYERLGGAGFPERRELFLEIRGEIALHSQIEKKLFYPAVRCVNVLTEELVKEALQNHRAADSRVEELNGMSSGDHAFDGAMGELRKSVERHSQIVETGIAPQASRLPTRTLRELGSEMEELETELRKDQAENGRVELGDAPSSPGAAGPAGTEPPQSYENWGSE